MTLDTSRSTPSRVMLMSHISQPPASISIDEFRAAMLGHEFHLCFQPQVDALGGRLIGFEALSRWQSPRFGSVGPDCFVPQMEKHGLADEFWAVLLDMVAQQSSFLASAETAQLHFALNLSAAQLDTRGLAARFAQWLRRSGLDAQNIHIELTESALFKLSDTVAENLYAFRDSGLAIWLDDFGTGYSSLQHLRDLPISGLKIDKSFVANLETDINDFRIVSAIVAMAASLGLKVVAEGVETEAQAQMLTQLGCTTLQGYLIGRPAPLAQLLHNWGMPAAA